MFNFILTIVMKTNVVKRYAFTTFESLMAYLSAQKMDYIKTVNIESSNIIMIEE